MPEVRHPLGERLVGVDARDEADDEDQEEGATPQGGAAIHVSRLAKSPPRLAPKPDAGVLPRIVHANLEMQVRARRVAGRSFVPDHVATRDDRAAAHAGVESRQVSVERGVAVAVDHQDVVPVAIRARVEVDDTRVSCDDRGAVRPRDVDARVDAVGIRTARLVLLEPVAVAGGTLADAAVGALWLTPLELAGSGN